MPTPTLAGPELLVNTTFASGTQRAPSAATLADGRVIITWLDYGTSNATVRYKIYNADGSAATAEIELNAGQSGLGVAEAPVVAALTGGGFAIAWQFLDSTGSSGPDLYVTTFNSELGVVSSPTFTPVAYNTSSSQIQPAIAARAGGGFTVAWTEYDIGVTGVQGNTAIMARDFLANGSPATTATYRLSDPRGGDFSAALASHIDGSSDLLNAVWDDNLGQVVSGPENEGTFGKEAGSLGGAVGNYTASGSTGGGDNRSSTPDTAYAPSGDFLTVWMTKPSALAAYEVAGRLKNASIPQFKINTTTLGGLGPTEGTASENLVAVAGSAHGYLVVWMDGGNEVGGASYDVVGQMINLDGSFNGSEFAISTTTAAFIDHVDVTAMLDGRFLVTWNGAASANIFSQIVEPRTGAAAWNGTATGEQYSGTPFNDDLRAAGGNDRIYGHDGNDFLQGGVGDDYVNGGSGFDALSFYDLPGSVVVTLSETGSGVANTAWGSDTYESIENLAGSDYGYTQGQPATFGGDVLTGNSGSNVLQGYWGNDQLSGMGGNDDLDGGFGDDVLDGGGDVDTAHIGTLGAVIAGTKSDFTITGSHGTDRLIGIENVHVEGGPTYSTAYIFDGGLAAPVHAHGSFGVGPGAGGWSNQGEMLRDLADVNGDGRADVVGFGTGGVWVALANGSGGFGDALLKLARFGSGVAAGGWTDDGLYPRELGDVNGDGRDDIVGFGYDGVTVALADGSGGFLQPQLGLGRFGAGVAAGGWSSNDVFPRMLGDVNGDGKDDVVGFGYDGVYVALATSGGFFAEAQLGLAGFGAGVGAGGWTSNDVFPRMLADVTGDGKDDVVGFGHGGVYVAAATGNGQFASPTLELARFGAGVAAGGWSSDTIYPRHVEDLNGDGRADIIGFGYDGVIVAMAKEAGGFTEPSLELARFGAGVAAGGWTHDGVYPREVADITGDGQADIVGFGYDGVFTSVSNGWFFV